MGRRRAAPKHQTTPLKRPPIMLACATRADHLPRVCVFALTCAAYGDGSWCGPGERCGVVTPHNVSVHAMSPMIVFVMSGVRCAVRALDVRVWQCGSRGERCVRSVSGYGVWRGDTLRCDKSS